MKRAVVFVFIVFLVQGIGLAQEKKVQARIDSLLAELPKMKDDTNKVNILNSLCDEYKLIGDYEKGQNFGNRGMELAQKTKYKLGQANSYFSLGVIFLNQSQFPKALEYFSNSKKINEEIGNKIGIASDIRNIGIIYFDLSDYPKALDCFFQSLLISQNLLLANPNDRKIKIGIAKSFNNIGLVYEAQNDSSKALAYYLKALHLNEGINDKRSVAVNLGNIGIVYINNHDYINALEYCIKSLKIKEELGEKNEIAKTLGNIGVIYFNQADYSKALEYYSNALIMNEKLGDKYFVIQNIANIGKTYLYILKAQGAIENKNETKKQSVFFTKPIIPLISRNDAIKKTNENITKAIALCKEIGDQDHLQECYEIHYEVQKISGDYKGALESFINHVQIKDSVFSAENQKKISEIEHLREEDVKQKKIEIQNIQLLSNKKERMYFVAGVIGLLFLLGFAYNRFKVTKKQKQIIEFKENETQKQKTIVERKNHEITQSIRYALRIQTAILPPQKIVKQYLENSFILYKPKDIVAGDFYWMEAPPSLPEGEEQQPSKSQQQEDMGVISSPSGRSGGAILFAACDCTGHGVPGAMVSVVCHNALNRAVREFGLTKPSEILDKTAEIVIENFSKSEENIKDGMDISLACLSPTLSEGEGAGTYTLQWAGANNPLWIVRNISSPSGRSGGAPELIEIKADKQPIGMNEDSKPFTNHTIALNSGDTIYLFTDGFADQFGGETGEKKLTRKRFKEVLLSIQHLSLTEQGIQLDKFITEYRKEVEQIDDILVMGVRV
ncbi:MAG: tetratricopeptide repeat protein [Bacteroidota bacterium]